jgi:hypothetical protein
MLRDIAIGKNVKHFETVGFEEAGDVTSNIFI